MLAGTLVLLSACLIGLILRARTAAGALALGAGGFLVSFAAAMLSEIFGPPALAAFLAGTGALSVRLLAATRLSRAKPVEQAHQADVP